MSPTIVRDLDGNNRIVIGAAGGPRIISAVFLCLLNRLTFQMPLPDAVAAPRFHHQWNPESLSLERFGFPWDTTSKLEAKGYTLKQVNRIGIVHALEHFIDGRSWGVADPRGEGAAVAE